MNRPAGWWAALRRRLGVLRPHRRHPRLVRRTHLHCPRTGEVVEVEIELGDTVAERRVLRCSAHPGASPPPCDARCRFAAEAFAGPAEALIILPEGCRDTTERD